MLALDTAADCKRDMDPEPGYPRSNLKFETDVQYAGIDNVFNILFNCSTCLYCNGCVCVLLCLVHTCACLSGAAL